MVQTLLQFPRRLKQAIIMMFDAIASTGCLFASFIIHFGYGYYPTGNIDLLVVIFLAPLIAILTFKGFGVYRDVIRYVEFKSLWVTSQAITFYTFLLGLIVFMSVVDFIPASVILINWLLLMIIIISSRLFARWLLSRFNSKQKTFNSTNVLIYGAGSAGRQLSTALSESSEFNLIAFIDDSNELINKSILGVEVFSNEDIGSLIDRKKIKEVLLAMPSITNNCRKQIINHLQSYPVTVRSLPSLSQLVSGRVTVNDLLEIDISDLLGRERVKPNKNLLKVNIFKKVVLVTGAGGSIGSELCRQMLLLRPKIIIIYDISESSLYQIEQEMKGLNNFNIEIFALIGSVADKDRMIDICKSFSVQTIYHAAAYKHVPLVENNPTQGVLNNLIGTLLLAEAAIISSVETFVLISTDKAVRPTNIMGATKRAAELTLQALSKLPHNTCFTMVRFGNVLDSSGSVIPLFKKQIKAGGPVTVTHPDIVRYFMTIPEAVELVIQAGAIATGGEIFVLDMGKPVKIYDLAVKMIKLSGLELLDENNPKGDIKIQFTELRPGEKLYEELLVGGKSIVTENKLIMRAEEDMISWDKLEPMLNELKEASTYWGGEEIYKLLKKLIPEFNPSYKSPDR